MYFDELYHARTATEFLQDWRYGEPHDIYEWTHPHLAKYAMAVSDRPSRQRPGDRSDGPRDIRRRRPRRTSLGRPDDAGGRAGDRFYVAGGDELRAYDLGSRELVARWSIPGATSLALDPVAHRVLNGTQSGAVHAIDTASELDVLRADSTPSPGTAAGPPEPLAQIGAPITHLAVTDDGTGLAAATSDGEVVSIDPGTGTIIGRAKVEGLAGLADGGTGDGLTGGPRDGHRCQGRRRDPAGPGGRRRRGLPGWTRPPGGDTTTPAVVLGHHLPAARAALDAAIADGRLAGFSVTPLPRIAAAGGNGVKFIAPSTGEVVDTVDIWGAGRRPREGDRRIHKPSLYVTLGDERMAVLRLPDMESKDLAPARHHVGDARPGRARALRRADPDGPRPVLDPGWHPASRSTSSSPTATRSSRMPGRPAAAGLGHRRRRWEPSGDRQANACLPQRMGAGLGRCWRPRSRRLTPGWSPGRSWPGSSTCSSGTFGDARSR